MNLFLILFFVSLSSICMANAESEINYYNSKQVIGNSLERMNQIEDLANKSVKFLPYCWDNRKDLNGCFRVSSMMFVIFTLGRGTVRRFWFDL